MHTILSKPWLVDDEEKWCNDTINLNEDDTKYVSFLMTNIIDGHEDESGCLLPCNYLKFNTKLMLFDDRTKKYGLFILFDDTVETTRSRMVINPETLITRIGGIIGVGKELLWIVLICSGAFTLFTAFFEEIRLKCS